VMELLVPDNMIFRNQLLHVQGLLVV